MSCSKDECGCEQKGKVSLDEDYVESLIEEYERRMHVMSQEYDNLETNMEYYRGVTNGMFSMVRLFLAMHYDKDIPPQDLGPHEIY